MLASDLNNPAFVGPQNPDSLLHVEFYWHEPVDKWATETTGKVVKGPKQPFIRIMKPGDKNSIIETAVREDHKARWPEKWLYWQMQEGLSEGPGDIPGWKLDEWNEIDDEQRRELKYLRFAVVEQIAGASDAQVQRMGMGGPGLREKAKQALRAKMGAETKAEIERKDREIAALQRQMDELKALLTAPRELPAPPPSVEPDSAQQPVEPPKKKGRPKGSKNKPKEPA